MCVVSDGGGEGNIASLSTFFFPQQYVFYFVFLFHFLFCLCFYFILLFHLFFRWKISHLGNFSFPELR